MHALDLSPIRSRIRPNIRSGGPRQLLPTISVLVGGDERHGSGLARRLDALHRG